jgi:hypothetical protein
MLVKLIHFYIIEPQRPIGGLIFLGGRVEHEIEHCDSTVRVGDGDGLYGEQWNLSGERRVSIVLRD